MAISGVGSNYNNVYEGTYAAQKNEEAKKAETKEATSAQAGKVQSTGEKAVSDYLKYVEAESESEAKAMMQKEKLEDAYYPKFDMNV